MTGWIKSSRCAANACLQAWPGNRTVWVRDVAGRVLVVERGDWAALLADVRAGSLR